MISKISNLFIWWNGQTIGTKIYTKFFGNFVGTDEYGNNYFKSSNGTKRWVNYKGVCDASNISPAWHSWIHKTTNKVPSFEKDNLSMSNSDDTYTEIKKMESIIQIILKIIRFLMIMNLGNQRIN